MGDLLDHLFSHRCRLGWGSGGLWPPRSAGVGRVADSAVLFAVPKGHPAAKTRSSRSTAYRFTPMLRCCQGRAHDTRLGVEVTRGDGAAWRGDREPLACRARGPEHSLSGPVRGPPAWPCGGAAPKRRSPPDAPAFARHRWPSADPGVWMQPFWRTRVWRSRAAVPRSRRVMPGRPQPDGRAACHRDHQCGRCRLNHLKAAVASLVTSLTERPDH